MKNLFLRGVRGCAWIVPEFLIRRNKVLMYKKKKEGVVIISCQLHAPKKLLKNYILSGVMGYPRIDHELLKRRKKILLFEEKKYGVITVE